MLKPGHQFIQSDAVIFPVGLDGRLVELQLIEQFRFDLIGFLLRWVHKAHESSHNHDDDDYKDKIESAEYGFRSRYGRIEVSCPG